MTDPELPAPISIYGIRVNLIIFLAIFYFPVMFLKRCTTSGNFGIKWRLASALFLMACVVFFTWRLIYNKILGWNSQMSKIVKLDTVEKVEKDFEEVPKSDMQMGLELELIDGRHSLEL